MDSSSPLKEPAMDVATEVEIATTAEDSESDSSLELESHYNFNLSSARTDPHRIEQAWEQKDKKLRTPVKKVAWAPVLEKVEYTPKEEEEDDDDEQKSESEYDELFIEKPHQTSSPQQDPVKMKGKEAFRQYIFQKYVNQSERYIFNSLDRPVCIPFNDCLPFINLLNCVSIIKRRDSVPLKICNQIKQQDDALQKRVKKTAAEARAVLYN